MLARRYRVAIPLLCAATVLGGSCNQPAPQLRPGPAHDGSAFWGWQIAQPLVAGFAADAVLHEVLGINVYLDGRLPANTGSWGFVAWSPSRLQSFQVNVKFDGTTTTDTRAAATAPGSNRQPIPGGWVNSTQVFQVAGANRPGGSANATLVVFNLGTWATAGLWGINYGSGPNYVVRWDGTYVGTQ